MIGGGLIIGGRRHYVHHVDVTTWEDAPDVAPRITDGRERPAGSALAIVMHTSRGRRSVVREGARPSDKGERLARYQSRTKRKVSWHLTGDTDGGVFQQADLDTWLAWHVEEANGWTIGYELVQHRDSPDLYRVQIEAAVAVIEATCAALSIPRRLFVGPDGAPWLKPVPDLLMRKYGGPGGRWPGILGHCQLVPDDVRGPGDPGGAIFEALLAAGFEGVVVPTVVTRATSAHAATSAQVPDGVPSWVDRSRRILDSGERIRVEPGAWARAAFAALLTLGLPEAAALEVVAHCAVECSWGTRAVGGNCGGVKLKKRDDDAHRAKHGRGLPWWSAPGHQASGDDPTEVYRGFASAEEFWAFFAKRYAPRPEVPAEAERYEDAGAALWSDTPERWFPELLLAGYRGPVREREAEELEARGELDEHPSVREHRDVVARVRVLVR